MSLVCKAPGVHDTELIYKTSHDVTGLVTLTNNIDQKGGAPFWFRNVQMSGIKLTGKPENSFGPVLWAMYTLSKGTLKLTAQMPPLGTKDNDQVELHLKKEGTWQLADTRKIDAAACTATFKLNNWNSGSEVPYRLIYKNNGREYQYAGTVRQEPKGTPLRFGGLTCQHGAGFPYAPLVKNLKKHEPAMINFSADQIYEGNGGYPTKRTTAQRATLSYLANGRT